MRAVLLHHAEAESPAVDANRPLTTGGRLQAEAAAASLQRSGFVPAAIWHSGKLRARQTAEAVLRHSPFAEYRMVRGLRPDDPPDWIRGDIEAETRNLLIVGHMPNISDLARALVPPCVGVPVHGYIILERKGHTEWLEVSRFPDSP